MTRRKTNLKTKDKKLSEEMVNKKVFDNSLRLDKIEKDKKICLFLGVSLFMVLIVFLWWLNFKNNFNSANVKADGDWLGLQEQIEKIKQDMDTGFEDLRQSETEKNENGEETEALEMVEFKKRLGDIIVDFETAEENLEIEK